MAPPPVPNWQAQILHGVGAPVTPQNLLFVNDWARAEGGGAANNPFNTTQPAAGASSYNSVGVRNYGSPEQGIQATIQTLKNGRYGGILGALQQGTSAKSSAQALAGSPWGTGSLVLKMLGAGPGSQAGGGAPLSAGPAAAPGIPNRQAFVSALLGAISPTGQLSNPSALVQALQTRQAGGALTFPSSGGGAEGRNLGSPSGGRGLAELLLEGTGGPTHSTGPHVHAAFTDPQAELAAIKEASALGLHVGENPYVGDTVDPVHAKNSYHYRDFPGTYNGRKLGEAIDVSGPNQNAFYKWLGGR